MKKISTVLILVILLFITIPVHAKIRLRGTDMPNMVDFSILSDNKVEIEYPSIPPQIKETYVTLEHRAINKGLAGNRHRYYLTVYRGNISPDLLFGDKNKVPMIEFYANNRLSQTVTCKKLMSSAKERIAIKIMLKEPEFEKILIADYAYLTLYFDDGSTTKVRISGEVFAEWKNITNKEFFSKVQSNTRNERRNEYFFSRDFDPYDLEPQ